MSTILNPKYLSMPEQVQKNKNDIEIINQYLQNVYKTSSSLTEDTTTINIENTDIDINNLNFSLLIDRQGHIYKIVNVIGEIVYLSFLTNIPGGTEYNFTGEWVSDNNEYYENDLVLYNSNLYLCELNIINSSTPPNEDLQHWSLFVGYGNSISEFVKSEWEKQLNLADEKNIEYGSGTLSPYANVVKLSNFTFKKDITYTIKLFDINSTNYRFYLNEKFANKINVSNYFVWATNYITFTALENIVYTSLEPLIKIESGSVTDVGKLMIVEGSVIPNEFIQYQGGKIIHEKDIEPVLLWKNGSPSVEFAGQSISTIRNSAFNKIIAIYKSYIDDDNAIIMEFERKTGFVSIINVYQNDSSQEVQTRRFKVLNDTTIQIEDCYKNKIVSNVNIIPLAFYGSNY